MMSLLYITCGFTCTAIASKLLPEMSNVSHILIGGTISYIVITVIAGGRR